MNERGYIAAWTYRSASPFSANFSTAIFTEAAMCYPVVQVCASLINLSTALYRAELVAVGVWARHS